MRLRLRLSKDVGVIQELPDRMLPKNASNILLLTSHISQKKLIANGQKPIAANTSHILQKKNEQNEIM